MKIYGPFPSHPVASIGTTVVLYVVAVASARGDNIFTPFSGTPALRKAGCIGVAPHNGHRPVYDEYKPARQILRGLAL